MAMVERRALPDSGVDWARALGDGHLRITPVDAVGLEARAAALAGRSIK
jgi:hypothetical protein